MGSSPSATGTNYPTPRHGEWVVHDFRFHTGEVFPELHLSYLTIGDPSGEPVLALHGTLATADSMLTPAFAGELFAPGQPLDAKDHYIIIPSSIGHGRSSKPSDGLRTRFPEYNYADMISAQHRLITEHLGIRRLRLIIGNSMGGMHTWMWGISHPHFMDALVPMAAQPSQVAGRNQMMRRMAIETIRQDPSYNNGNYTDQPRSLKVADAFLKIGMNGGELALANKAPTRERADELVGKQLAAPTEMDANDFIYRFSASRDYDPSAGLERIEAPLLAINSADDERNPPDNGILQRELKRVKNARLYLIPASSETSGHSTIANAKFYKHALQSFLQGVPRRTAS